MVHIKKKNLKTIYDTKSKEKETECSRGDDFKQR